MLCFQGREFEAQVTISKADEDVEEWTARKDLNPQPNPQAIIERQRVKWEPPPQNWVKCNTDGTWTAEANTCGVGWVLRNEEGKVLWLGSRALPKIKTVLETELEALRWAVLSISNFNYKRVAFESDSQQVVSLMTEGTLLPHLEPIVQDIRRLIQQFEEVKFMFINREGNRVADRTARESLSLRNGDAKLYSIMPNWIINLVDSDNCN